MLIWSFCKPSGCEDVIFTEIFSFERSIIKSGTL